MLHLRQLFAVFLLAMALVGISWNDQITNSRRLGEGSVTTTINKSSGIRATTTNAHNKKNKKKFDPKTVQYKAGAAAAADQTKLQGTKTAGKKKSDKKKKKKLFSLKPSKRASMKKDKISKKTKKANAKANKKM